MPGYLDEAAEKVDPAKAVSQVVGCVKHTTARCCGAFHAPYTKNRLFQQPLGRSRAASPGTGSPLYRACPIRIAADQTAVMSVIGPPIHLLWSNAGSTGLPTLDCRDTMQSSHEPLCRPHPICIMSRHE